MRIKGKKYPVKQEDQTNKLCFKCKNAAGGCSWSRDFEPVEGWTATPTYPKYQGKVYVDPRIMKQSYHITACPLFEEG